MTRLSLRSRQPSSSPCVCVASLARAASPPIVAGRCRTARRSRRPSARCCSVRAIANAPSADGTTALHWAVQRDDVEMVDLLLKAGADARPRIATASRRCYVACTERQRRRSSSGCSRRAPMPNAALPEGETALMTAARTGKVEAVKLLLAHGADVNAQGTVARPDGADVGRGREPRRGRADRSIEAGADLKARSNGGFTPLLFAVRAGTPRGRARRCWRSGRDRRTKRSRRAPRPRGDGRGALRRRPAAHGRRHRQRGWPDGLSTSSSDPRRRTLVPGLQHRARGRVGRTVRARALWSWPS